jgi:hypothetical protein
LRELVLSTHASSDHPGGAPEAVTHPNSLARSRTISFGYFFLSDPKLGCHPADFWLGAAAMTLIFSFLGFLLSRLPFC